MLVDTMDLITNPPEGKETVMNLRTGRFYLRDVVPYDAEATWQGYVEAMHNHDETGERLYHCLLSAKGRPARIIELARKMGLED